MVRRDHNIRVLFINFTKLCKIKKFNHEKCFITIIFYYHIQKSLQKTKQLIILTVIHIFPTVKLRSFKLSNLSIPGDNLKNRRPSSHGPRSPGSIEANIDSRFAASSPGLLFNHHSNLSNNPTINPYKISNSNLQVEVTKLILI